MNVPLIDDVPKFSEAKPIMEKLFEHWRNVNDVQQLPWVSTIRNVFEKLASVQNKPSLLNGVHELISSIHFMTVANPQGLLNHYPCMASLGHTTTRLKRFCKWNQKLFETITQVSQKYLELQLLTIILGNRGKKSIVGLVKNF